jgi:hypothetical protein
VNPARLLAALSVAFPLYASGQVDLTLTGETCNGCTVNGGGTITPFSMTLDLNPLTGLFTVENPISFNPDATVIETFIATENGHPVYSAAPLTVAFDPTTGSGTVLDTPGPSPTGIQNFNWEFGLHPGPFTTTTTLVPTNTTWITSPIYTQTVNEEDLEVGAYFWGSKSSLVSVPEPGVSALFLLGLAGVALQGRKKIWRVRTTSGV